MLTAATAAGRTALVGVGEEEDGLVGVVDVVAARQRWSLVRWTMGFRRGCRRR